MKNNNSCVQIEADTRVKCVQSFQMGINNCIEIKCHRFEQLL